MTAPGQGPATPDKRLIVPVLGVMQIASWGTTFYLPTILAEPIAADTGWSLTWTTSALSLGLLTSGFAAPFVGRAIERCGGRPVLAGGAVLCATGLAGLAVAPWLAFYVAAWVVIGLGMAAALYDAAFSTLGRIYGAEARQSITMITLFGGLASTACWPLTAYLSAEFGWRGACLVYAGWHLLVAAPSALLVLPREARHQRGASDAADASAPAPQGLSLRFVLLATALALSAAISGAISMHLMTLLQARDISLAAAVALGTLVGPSQVASRVVELLIGRYHHPIWTLIAATVLIAAGLALLWAAGGALTAALMLYGAGVGIYSIARGTLPLALFGAHGYAATMGLLARPALILGAASPTLAAVLIDQAGADVTLATLVALAVANIGVAAALFFAAAEKGADG